VIVLDASIRVAASNHPHDLPKRIILDGLLLTLHFCLDQLARDSRYTATVALGSLF